jgi:hypothetical protein
MMPFNEYLDKQIVRKVRSYPSRRDALINESLIKYQTIMQMQKALPIDERTAQIYIDQIYDCLLQLIRAKMFFDGYKTLSHEAEVSYALVLGLSGVDVKLLDELRYIRNGNKYYGEQIKKGYALQVYKYFLDVYPILKKLCT